MKELNIKGTQSTPEISARWDDGVLSMSGDSYPENSFEFFGEVIGWLEEYLQKSEQALHLELRLIYINTSSVKAMMDIFDLCEEAFGRGRAVRVNWYYDPRNERVLDLADEFKEDCSFPFEITEDAQH
ncbi:MAG: hypothetical protein CGU28_02340 [Candidatus Dactylopiibacterium carminicum]|uniref:DUF1987 domain-containing protein n=1 Tax=Candidatus Dactylopiibacterium carminicum TaxID=857335 RepID=A0A272EVB5_9RHOO|nr:biofilm regulation phosphoprotein SiaC [Candidatus Dactylopiibacterium carminicum]KAF7600125.1 DUF1987 domain-containing protein [Candidatus Dactylopiibacterium carminicum]PAS94045.1 MAG: hypothetical protein CGU29_05235 [Candidatus Dactylopiibacterium carminicum]PAS98191.1 MAG: hypothetical protein CGU28_02340 [Candidatus Dactylopiibacterium carminicum]PAT00123.1 MAG: hypothetical protein BSR46_04345 [Candidatus Dactylopiibacterium carminicum]